MAGGGIIHGHGRCALGEREAGQGSRRRGSATWQPSKGACGVGGSARTVGSGAGAWDPSHVPVLCFWAQNRGEGGTEGGG